MYIPKIDDYLKILADEEVKIFVTINFSEYSKEEQNNRKVAKLVYIFLTTPDEVQSNSSNNCIHHYNVKIFLNFVDPELELINTKPVIKSKLKELSKFKKFKVQILLVLGYKK